MIHGFKEMRSTNRWEKCNTSMYEAIYNLLKLMSISLRHS